MQRVIRSSIIFVVIAGIVGTGVLFAEAPGDMFVTKSFTTDDISVGWVGDMVPSEDGSYNQAVLGAVQDALSAPDLMIGNLEGTFALPGRVDKCVYINTMCHAFAGDPSFAGSLKDAGFDLVSLVNNHSYDFGKEGLADTEAVLDEVSIAYIAPDKPTTSIVVKGKTIGILGLSSTEPASTITDYDFIRTTVAKLKQQNDFVIVIFHGGAEGSDKTIVPGATEYVGNENRGDVERVAHTAIDAGADLVLGSGPHVLRKIETYKTKPIAYSLGNFVGGKHLVTTGILGVSGIFSATLSPDHPSTIDFTSILLSGDGAPSIDLFDQGKYLIESLSK